jgi:hypothetical protein
VIETQTHTPPSAPSRWAPIGWAVLATLLLPTVATAAGAGSPPTLVLGYIDPGTGSFLVQAIVAAVAGIAVTSRMYWEKIRGFFGATPRDAEEMDDDDLDG